MGTESIPTRASLQTITATFFNIFKSVMIGDFVPRDSNGDAVTEEGSLGTSSIAWLRAHISSGYFTIGDIKAHHTYNATAPITQGWMLCDGTVINEANYNTEHSAGDWAKYIVSSALDGKNLPDLTGKYLVGAATTTQDGSSPLTFVGNASNQINIAHSHTVNSHNHQWYNDQDSTTNDQTFDVNGASIDLVNGGTKGGGGRSHIFFDGGTTAFIGDSWTDNRVPGTNSQLSATQSIQPESLEVVYFMRII